MSYTIAVAGKGGTGKTTLTGFLVDWLTRMGRRPVLAVDADANSNLNEVLGVDIDITLGSLREEIKDSEIDPDSRIPGGMTKQEYLTFKFNDALIEEDDYDMLVMGRTQGTGCYCFVNGLLQTQIRKLSQNYKYVVVDNEAGMEHLSRGVLPGVDMIILVSDCSRRGVQAVARIAALIGELDMHPSKVGLIINRAPEGELPQGIQDEIEKNGLTLYGVVPQDQSVFEYDSEGRPLIELPTESIAKKSAEEIFQEIIS
jgi:CO dehydrogenase maturation factor